MCGRFTLRTPASILANWFPGIDFPLLEPRFNIAPSQQVLALRHNSDNVLEAVMLRWGLVPGWAGDLRIGNRMINARSETVQTKPAFRQAFKRQRCLILADGFYEWKETPQGKQPYFIHSADKSLPLFSFAGLWESWTPCTAPMESPPSQRQLDLFAEDVADTEASIEDGCGQRKPCSDSSPIESCTILTTTANAFMSQIHHRMPVMLAAPAHSVWLDRDLDDHEALTPLLAPRSTAQLAMYPVSQRVNKPSFDQSDCVQAIALPE